MPLPNPQRIARGCAPFARQKFPPQPVVWALLLMLLATLACSRPTASGASLVRVTQQYAQTHDVWTTTMEGVVVRYQQAKTGSWFVHGRDDKVWLDRLEIRLDDGELVTLNLDQYSVIEFVAAK